MKNLLYIIGFFFSAMLLFSCEPNRAEDGDLLFGVVPPDEQPPVAAVKYLSEVTAETDGETQTIKYTYENNNLVAVNSDGEDAISYNLTYENGKIAEAIIKQEIDGQAVTTVLDLTYDSKNLLISAEGDVKSDNDEKILYKTKTEFTYTASNNVRPKTIKTVYSKQNQYNLNDYEPYMDVVNEIAYNDNNVSQSKQTKKMLLDATIGDEINIVKFNSYDSKKNPFATLPSAYKLLSMQYRMTPGVLAGFSQNNFTEIEDKEKTVKLIYTYEGDYPSLADGGSNSKTSFKYQQ